MNARVRRLHDEVPLLVAVAIVSLTDLVVAAGPGLPGPEFSTTWILRLLAFGLLLAVVLRRRRQMQAENVQAAVGQERERIARELHDGLAQDLAFIIAYGQRHQSDLGPDHPLIIAASRALAVSRGALVDLSAATADCTAGALRNVAHELARRFEVRIGVTVEDDGAAADDVGLDAVSRDEIVRIVREAIVNAIRHGGARRVEVALSRCGREITLRVSDDGCGCGGGPEGLHRRHGFGLPTMRARAQALGGRLTASTGSLGGTELAVLFPDRDGCRPRRLKRIAGNAKIVMSHLPAGGHRRSRRSGRCGPVARTPESRTSDVRAICHTAIPTDAGDPLANRS